MAEYHERAKRESYVEITEADYDEMLGVVPPAAYLPHGFVMGEPWSFDVFYCFFCFDGRYWCKLATIDEARTIVDINEHGIGYRRQPA